MKKKEQNQRCFCSAGLEGKKVLCTGTQWESTCSRLCFSPTQPPVGIPGSKIQLCCMEKCLLMLGLAIAGMSSVVMPIEA